jgi:CDP-paratose 2-epimerase
MLRAAADVVARSFGVVEWFELGERERAERVCAGLSAIGVERLRTGVSWADWHRPDGPAWYAWLLPRLACEFELLPCLHHTPPSLGIAATVQSPPRRPRDFADFIDLFLDVHGRLFEHIELWNEPNNLSDWDWRLDPGWSVFCAMIGDAAHWARHRGKKTVLGGMCPIDAHWLSILGERGVLAKLDAIGIHAFPGGWTTAWSGWSEAVFSVREVLERYASQAEIWVTETGFSTWRDDEVGQLRALVEAVDAQPERLYWYAAEDLGNERAACDGFHVDERHYRFGLADAQGRPKLAARVLGAAGLIGASDFADIAAPSGSRRRGPVTVITGGAGFIGSNLAHALLQAGEHVRIVDNLSRPGAEQNLAWLRAQHDVLLEFAAVDVRDRISLRRAVAGAATVFHLAAQVAVTTSLDDPNADFNVNLAGTFGLLEEVRSLPQPPNVVFTSTNKVYGSLSRAPVVLEDSRWLPVDRRLRSRGIDEEHPLDFSTPYGCSKGAADQYVLDYATSFGLSAAVMRMSCIYGPHQHGNEDQGWIAHFLLRTIGADAVTIYGDGAQVRDVLYVDDLVRALRLVRDSIDKLSGTAFNIGGGPANALSLLELLDLIEDVHGVRPVVSFADERLGDQRWYVSDTTRLCSATAWTPCTSPAVGVEALYRWLVGDKSALQASAA